MKTAIFALLLAAQPALGGERGGAPAAVRLDLATPSVSRPGLWDRATAWARPEALPGFPPKAGETIRVAGRAYVLDAPLGGGNTALVRSAVAGDGSRVAVKVLAPEFRSDPLGEDEPGALAALERTDVPHARLLAKSKDSSVLVKELVDGPKLSEVERLDTRQRTALGELARRLIALGYTADLSENNLIWNGVEWKLVDAGGFAPAPAEKTLSQLRQRLGPEFGTQPR